MRTVAAFGIGALFAVGLVVGGMTQPSKVIGFLDFFGDWDPSLAFVMGGAIAVHALTLPFIRRRDEAVLGGPLRIPTRTHLDRKLLGGAAVFGVGWGLGGYCPGPGIVAAPTLAVEALVFVAAMALGVLAHDATRRAQTRRLESR